MLRIGRCISDIFPGGGKEAAFRQIKPYLPIIKVILEKQLQKLIIFFGEAKCLKKLGE
jgi:hypothetical protein